MSEQAVRTMLGTMAETPGLHGCALVEVQSGMVWHQVGHITDLQFLTEAASDYWRLSGRLTEQFDPLGPLEAGVMIHARGRITLLPCGQGMVLLALTDKNPRIDWHHWQQRASQLARLVDRF